MGHLFSDLQTWAQSTAFAKHKEVSRIKTGNQTDLNIVKLSEYTMKTCVCLHEYTEYTMKACIRLLEYTETSIFKGTEGSLESATDSPPQHVLCSREYMS